MVKLSYVTRKIEGSKLANSVCKDIRKKIHKEGIKVVKRAAGTVSDNIELNLTGKNIGDEGLALVCEALQEGLLEGHFRVVELHLSGTGITVAGLISLIPVIRTASTQLKDLVLSDNKISVRTNEDVVAWERFLESFSNVCSLIRLDLSGNPLGAEFAGETLLRCFSLAKPVQIEDTFKLGGQTREELSDAQLENGLKGQNGGIKQPRFINSGLRSIPFIVLRNLDITAGFALHLSYIIEGHFPANTLLKLHQSGAKPGTDLYSFIQSVEELDERPYCGVIYEPVRSISANAHKTLDAAVREVIPESEESSSEFEEQDPEDSPRAKIKKIQLGVFDVTRCRIKLQGSVLQEGDGTSLVQLWDSAVKLLSATRAIMLTKQNRKLFVKRISDAQVAVQLAALPVIPIFSPPLPKTKQSHQQPQIKTQPRENYDSAFPTLDNLKNSGPSQHRPKIEPKPITPAKPLTSRALNKNTHPDGKHIKKSPNSKGGKSWAALKDIPAPKKETITFVVPRGCTLASLSTLPSPAPLPEPLVAPPPALKIETTFTWHSGPPNSLITPLTPLGKKQLPLPVALWKRILQEAHDPNGLLSTEQTEKIWNFAVNFETLVMGLEQMRGRRKSDHIWRFLDSVGCLSYTIRK